MEAKINKNGGITLKTQNKRDIEVLWCFYNQTEEDKVKFLNKGRDNKYLKIPKFNVEFNNLLGDWDTIDKCLQQNYTENEE